ncbi:unnamed protein product, partial [Prorocentrum cordatum]
GGPPGVEQAQVLVEQASGFSSRTGPRPRRTSGRRCSRRRSATSAATKPGGSAKHRVIQDLKANSVNEAVALTERQVLPAIHDHAIDLAMLSAQARQGEVAWTLVLDLADAFMSVPLHVDENRLALYLQAAEGDFVAWRVLGFGGKPNPVAFGPVVSFAARTAQALFRPFAQSTARHASAAAFVLGRPFSRPPLWTARCGWKFGLALRAIALAARGAAFQKCFRGAGGVPDSGGERGQGSPSRGRSTPLVARPSLK